MQNPIEHNTTYLILAGGRGQRMNGVDKGLMPWKNRPMIEHVLEQLSVPVKNVIISANRNQQTYKQYADCVIEDNLNDFQGPLSGILSAMHVCDTKYLLCVPCDSPNPPNDMLMQLYKCMQSQQKTSAVCHDGERLQPLFALISCSNENLLNEFIQQGRRKVHDFIQLIDPAICDFSTQKDHFNNFNQPDDMQL